MKTIILKSGVKVPTLGLGTWMLKGENGKNAVKYALEIGYRHVDTADSYDNHQDVGKGIKESNVSREDIFITSKVFHDNLSPKGISETSERILKELDIEYLDLLLLHWPDRSIPVKDQLETIQRLKERGLVKAIGVSNYNIHHLKDSLSTGIEFEVNQVEFHPSLNQKELKQFCDDNGIAVTAYSPIAQGQDLKLPEVLQLAKKYKKTPAQIILNWLMGIGVIVIPRSVKKIHIQENFGALGWEMTEEDMKILNKLNLDNRIVIPEWSDFEY